MGEEGVNSMRKVLPIYNHIYNFENANGSLVLKQTKGVTDRKGTLLRKCFSEFCQKLFRSS